MTDPDMLAEIKAKRLPPEGLKLGISKEDVEWLLARVEALDHESADARTQAILSEEEGDQLRAALTLSDEEAGFLLFTAELRGIRVSDAEIKLRWQELRPSEREGYAESMGVVVADLRRRAGMTP